MFRILLVGFLVLLSGVGQASGSEFRLGIMGGYELDEDRPDAFDQRSAPYPGLYWEYMSAHVGIGMTYLVEFERYETSIPGMDHTWDFDWIGTLDFRFHFMTSEGLDPFVEAGIGNAGRTDITSYKPEWKDERREILLSLFEQVGGGVTLLFEDMHLGGKVLVRVFNEPVPGTRYEVYPLGDFQFSVFGGVRF